MVAARMIVSILDTNVLVRFFVGDNNTQKEKAAQWLKAAAEGKRVLVLTPIVIAETSFVLESFYKLPRDTIADALEVFVSQRWLDVRDRAPLAHLWPLYRKGFHFVDSYLRAWISMHGGELMTFDKKLMR